MKKSVSIIQFIEIKSIQVYNYIYAEVNGLENWQMIQKIRMTYEET
jgi:hypothetical protein